MEVSNVSRQLYNQQLPEASTDKSQDDYLIEDAFQKQLNLSEYYKGTTPYQVIKKEFMDLSSENLVPNGIEVKELYPFPESNNKRNVSGFSEVSEPRKENTGVYSTYMWITLSVILIILLYFRLL